MMSAGSDPPAAPAGNPPASGRPLHVSFWLRELPYILVFILTILGVAYTTYTKRPVVGYWALLAPVMASVCVGAGWHPAGWPEFPEPESVRKQHALHCVTIGAVT